MHIEWIREHKYWVFTEYPDMYSAMGNLSLYGCKNLNGRAWRKKWVTPKSLAASYHRLMSLTRLFLLTLHARASKCRFIEAWTRRRWVTIFKRPVNAGSERVAWQAPLWISCSAMCFRQTEASFYYPYQSRLPLYGAVGFGIVLPEGPDQSTQSMGFLDWLRRSIWRGRVGRCSGPW